MPNKIGGNGKVAAATAVLKKHKRMKQKHLHPHHHHHVTATDLASTLRRLSCISETSEASDTEFMLENLDLDEEVLPGLISSLQELLKDDSDPCWRKDDEFCALFIRTKGYNLERAFNGIRFCQRNAHKHLEITQGIRPSQFLSVYDDQIILALKTRCKLGTKVGLARAGPWDTKKHGIQKLLQATLVAVAEAVQDKANQLSGMSIIFDMKGLSFSHVRQVTPKVLQRLALCAQDGAPLKVNAVHFVNFPSIFWILFYMAQPFLKEKLRSRLHFHENLQSLHAHFDMENFPKVIGGKLELADAIDIDFHERLLQNDRYFEDYYFSKENVSQTNLIMD